MSRRSMVTILVWVASLAPVGATASEPDSSRSSRPLPLVSPAGPETLLLEWLDVSSVTGGVDGIARSETRATLRRAGIDVVWRRGDPKDAARPGEIRVILVDRLLVKPETGLPVLGATPTRLREQPFVWVHVRSVRAALGQAVRGPTRNLPASRRRDLGVALGRVIAHEIVHALAPGLDHGEELMSESLRPADLSGRPLEVAPEVATAILASLRRGSPGAQPTVVAAGGSAPGSVSGGVPPEAGADLAP